MATEYDDIVREQKADQLRSALYVGARQAPDTEAKVQALASRAGLPVDAVCRHQPEVELSDKLRSFDYDKVIAENPKLSAWMTDPKNSAVAHDDWESLSRTERLLTRGRDYLGALTGGIVGQGAGSTLSGLGELYGVYARGVQRAAGAVLPQSVITAGPTLPWWTDPQQILDRPGEALKQLGREMGPPASRQSLGTDVAQGIGQLGFQIAAYLFTGGVSSTSTMLAQGADIMADRTATDAAAPAARDAAIVTGAAVTAITERYGLDKILNRVPPAIRNRTLRFIADKLAAGGIEAAQEAAEGVLHDITRHVLTDRTQEVGAGLTREMTAAGLAAAVVRTALGVRGYRQAQQTEDFIKAIAEDAKGSKLRERLPERYRDLIDHYTQDGPVQQVLIPAERFVEYFQTAGIDPEAAAADIGATNFVEAVAAGSDVVIPMQAFIANVAASDHLQGLAPDIRLAPDEMTPREAAEAEKNAAEIEKQVQEEVGKIDEAAKASEGLDAVIQRIVADAESQLATRYDAATARQLATVMRGVAVLAQRANPNADPLEAAQALWTKYGLNIDALARAGEAGADGLQFEQALASQPPKGWKHSTDGADAVALWEGQSEHRAVFWTDMKGKLEQDAPARAGYSHSVDVSALGHIRREHGDVESEAQRGQAAITERDIAAIPEIVTSYDAVRQVTDKRGRPIIAYAKRIGDGVTVYLEEVSDRRRNLRGVSMRRYLTSSDAGAILERTVRDELNALSERSIPAHEQTVDEGGAKFNQAAAPNMDKRGSLQIGADRRMRISLFEKANFSTFLHETGHFYLEVLGDLAENADSDQALRDDYAKILKWLRVNNRGQITREHHEKWARANEAYLMEGKAPTPELRGVFQRFAAWLRLIYRQLDALNVQLTDEVRGVMDRIYASDAEIERAEAEANLESLFLDAKSAGMTEAEFALYRAAVAEQTVEAKERLQRKLMRAEKLKREKWWKDERAKVAEEVAAEFDATPVAQAFGRMTGKDSAERMSKQQLVDRYGADVLKRLPRGYTEGRGVAYAEGGQDLDSLAEVMGFATADDMVQQLLAMPSRARHIAQQAEARMMERHGDLLNAIALADEAMAAVHNEQREKVLRMELRALNRKAREVGPFVRAERDRAKEDARQARAATDVPNASVFRNIARGLIGQKQVRDLNPNVHLIAERKASRAAFEAMAKGDYVEAQQQKQRELLSHYLYLEATTAKQEAGKVVAYLKGFESESKRAALAKAGADYLAQIEALLERYSFAKISKKEVGRRESLAAWLQQQEADGAMVAVPEVVQNEARRVNWQSVPMDELRALRDAVRNISHLAGLKNKLIRKRKAIEFGEVVDDLLAAIEASGLESTGDLNRPNMVGEGIAARGAAAWRKFDAAHLKVEQLVSWLDGGRIDGPWAHYLFDLADDAQTTEYDLHAEITQKLEALSAGMPKAWRHALTDRTAVGLPGFDKPVTRYDLISIALNMGNEQNLQRLRDGYGWQEIDFARIRAALTAEDWRYVQGVWDTLETLWPHMAALEERTSGLPPEKVQAVRFEAAGATWRGGYFPLVYDPRFSNAGERQGSEAESVQNFVAQGYGRASTNRGATKQRVETLKAKPLLDYEQVITSHLAKVIKDISHREAVLGIHKILTQPQIKEALIDRVGQEQYQDLRRWLQVLVNDRADTLHQASGLGRFVMAARTNMAIVTMGWKISTMMAQFAGLGPSLDVVKPRFFGKALIHAVQSPAETWTLVAAKSGEMRNRANTIERDARDALLRMRGERGVTASVRRTAFYLTALADRMISTPTWLGAYQQALAEGQGEEDAVRAGDRAVRLSQGAGGSKDLAAVQRNNELMKLLTMYYTPFNVLYARLRDVGHQGALQGIGYLPKAAARLLALVVLPAVLGELLASRGPDDDEDPVWWSIRKTLLYPVATIPVVRDLAGYLEAAMIELSGSGEMKFRPEYRLSPVVSAIEKVARLPGRMVDAATGEAEVADAVWDVFEAAGYVAGLPTAQVRITGEYLVDLLSGNAEPEDAAELLRDALYRRPRE